MIPLDTSDPQYRVYFTTVRERIKSRWTYPRQAAERGIEGELLIEFHIAKDGRLEFIALRNSSGSTMLDDYATAAVKLAQPFPPIPTGLDGPVRVQSAFCYRIMHGQTNQNLR